MHFLPLTAQESNSATNTYCGDRRPTVLNSFITLLFDSISGSQTSLSFINVAKPFEFLFFITITISTRAERVRSMNLQESCYSEVPTYSIVKSK